MHSTSELVIWTYCSVLVTNTGSSMLFLCTQSCSFHQGQHKHMNVFSKLFGSGSKELQHIMDTNPLIIDVRSPLEYAGGHVPDSTNIPLNQLQSALDNLPVDRPIVFCCASGARSGQAARLAVSHGLKAVNGGPWTAVRDMMRGR